MRIDRLIHLGPAPLHRQMSGAIKLPGELPGCLGKHTVLFRLRRIGELCLNTSDVNDITMIDQLVNWPWRRIALRAPCSPAMFQVIEASNSSCSD